MKYYKLTNQKNETANNTVWGDGVTHVATGAGRRLCSDAVIHVYAHPLLAVLFNPLHAAIDNPKLWGCETSEPVNQDGLKIGVKSCTTIKEIPLPIITTEQKVKFAILCAKEVYKDEVWNTWADKWLSGEDRTVKAAGAAVVAVDAAARAAAVAAAVAADAAARAAARAAVAAAEAAADAAARADDNIDFVSLALEAIK